MKILLPAIGTVCAAFFSGRAAAGDGAQALRFGKEDVGRTPANWQSTRTGTGDGSIWKVVEDATGPGKSGYVIAQTAASPRKLFNLCVWREGKFKDVAVTVAFKANRGQEDQGGGIVWRYQDADNYYVARMNPLEDNLRVYKVVGGKRTQLQTCEGLKVPAGEWHTLAIRMAGAKIECALDGKTLLRAEDETFTVAGLVGLWTKADAQTSFDQIEVRSLKK